MIGTTPAFPNTYVFALKMIPKKYRTELCSDKGADENTLMVRAFTTDDKDVKSTLVRSATYASKLMCKLELQSSHCVNRRPELNMTTLVQRNFVN